MTLADWKTCAEIRLNIYRFLLLDPPETYLSTPWEQKYDDKPFPDEIGYASDYWANSSQDNYKDDCKDVDYYYLSMDQAFQESFAEATWEQKSIWKLRVYPYSSVRRYPNILRTNRQIYSEASSMLYSELKVNLQPGDVLCTKASKDIVTASERVWRHSPLDGVGITNGDGQTVYSKPALDGVMEPHVLARFRNFAFELCIDWELETLESDPPHFIMQRGHGVAPILVVDRDMTVDPEQEAYLLAFYKQSTLVPQLVQILSNSTDIRSLEIFFDLNVPVMDSLAGVSDSDDDEAHSKMEDVANERAMEIFMDGGFFAPLENLSNVRSFKFEFTWFDNNGKIYQPKPRHERMLTGLKQKIKDNYARRHP